MIILININKIIIKTGLFLLFFACVTSCKKNNFKEDASGSETPADNSKNEIPKGIATHQLKIVLPEKSSVTDLAELKVYSISLVVSSDADGKVTIPYNKDYPDVAWVLDKDGDPILSGFITDSTASIDISSTAEVLLYLGLGTSFQPEEVITKFVNGASKLRGVSEWKSDLEQLFISDPKMLRKGKFSEGLQSKVAEIINTGQIERKSADILVDANDIRSGIQVWQSGLNQVKLTNNIRRRAHAFVYKTGYTDDNGNSTTLHETISDGVASIADVPVSATGAIRDYKGVLQDWAAGKGMEFAATTTEPMYIPLEDNEKTADYKVRVIGPGKPVSNSMTSKERDRWWNLSLRTALLDFILPGLTDAIGQKDILGYYDVPVGKQLPALDKLLDKTSVLIGTLPAAVDAMESGDMKTVFKEVFSALINGAMSDAVNTWFEAIYEGMGDYMLNKGMTGMGNAKDVMDFINRSEDLVKILEVIDLGLKGVDYARLAGAILRSNTIEEWDMKAKEIKVTLSPSSFVLCSESKKELTAYLQADTGDDQPVIQYEWETTGKYGYLTDERGHQGTTFMSSVNKVVYNSNSPDPDQENSRDTIKLTVYQKNGQEQMKIGSAISVATVVKDSLVISVPVSVVQPILEHLPQSGEGGYFQYERYLLYPLYSAGIEPIDGVTSFKFKEIKRNGKTGMTGVRQKSTWQGDESQFWKVTYPFGNYYEYYLPGPIVDCSPVYTFSAPAEISAAISGFEESAQKMQTYASALEACWAESGESIVAVEFTIYLCTTGSSEGGSEEEDPPVMVH